MAITTLIFWQSNVPSLSSGFDDKVLNQIVRKSGHVVIYFLLVGSFGKIVSGAIVNRSLRLLLCIAVGVCVAVIDEFNQTKVAGRNGNIVGFTFDLAGILLFVGIVARAKRPGVNKKNES